MEAREGPVRSGFRCNLRQLAIADQADLDGIGGQWSLSGRSRDRFFWGQYNASCRINRDATSLAMLACWA